MSKKKTCNAPCVINASDGFHLGSCEEEVVHDGDHSFHRKDFSSGKDVCISWNYLNTGITGTAGISHAPTMNGQRCDEWTHVPSFPKLRPGSDATRYDQRLLSVVEPEKNVHIGFCCEKTHEHDGEHVRSGVFGPLGINWKITW